MTTTAHRAEVGAGGKQPASESLGPSRRDWEEQFGGSDLQEAPSLLNPAFSPAVGEEPEVADTDETARQNVQQKAAQEFCGLQAKRFDAAVLAVILPAETDSGAVDGEQVVIGDRHAVGVTAQILDYSAPAAAQKRRP